MKISSNGIELNVTETGEGSTALVFLHHWGGSSKTWSQVIARLSDRYRCIAIDARGAGDSQAPSSGFSTNDHADDALNVIKALGIERYILVGHSMGGKASQLLASRRPDGLQGLVLVASSPLSPMKIGDEQRTQMKVAYQDRNSVAWSLDNVLVGSQISPESRTQLITDALRLSPEATLGWIECGTREDFSSQASNINVPVAIVAGELDRVDVPAVVDAHIVSHYPSASVRYLAGKGHLLPLEAAEEVAAVIGAMARALENPSGHKDL